MASTAGVSAGSGSPSSSLDRDEAEASVVELARGSSTATRKVELACPDLGGIGRIPPVSSIGLWHVSHLLGASACGAATRARTDRTPRGAAIRPDPQGRGRDRPMGRGWAGRSVGARVPYRRNETGLPDGRVEVLLGRRLLVGGDAIVVLLRASPRR